MSRVGLGAAAYTLRFFPGFHRACTSGSGRAGRRTRPAGKTQLHGGVGEQQPENARERCEKFWRRRLLKRTLGQLQAESRGLGTQQQLPAWRNGVHWPHLMLCSRPT